MGLRDSIGDAVVSWAASGRWVVPRFTPVGGTRLARRGGAGVTVFVAVCIAMGPAFGAKEQPAGLTDSVLAHLAAARPLWDQSQVGDFAAYVESLLAETPVKQTPPGESAALRADCVAWLEHILPNRLSGPAGLQVEKERLRLAFAAYAERRPISEADEAIIREQIARLFTDVRAEVRTCLESIDLSPYDRYGKSIFKAVDRWEQDCLFAMSNRLSTLSKRPLTAQELANAKSLCQAAAREWRSLPLEEQLQLLDRRAPAFAARLCAGLEFPLPTSPRLKELSRKARAERAERNRRILLEHTVESRRRQFEWEHDGVVPTPEELLEAVLEEIGPNGIGPAGVADSEDAITEAIAESLAKAEREPALELAPR
jgi:hypothetical protein